MEARTKTNNLAAAEEKPGNGLSTKAGGRAVMLHAI